MTDIKKLCSLFDRYAHDKNRAIAFTEMLDSFLLPFKFCATKQEQEVHLAQLTSQPKQEELFSFLEELGECSQHFCDPLGEIFMQEVSKGHNGQFFTPEHICDMMAQITAVNIKDGQSVFDPACGSGRMLLAVAKVNRHVVLYGADIDEVCVKMSVVNMLLQSLDGEITHMNTLTNEFFKGYCAGSTLYNGYYFPWYKQFLDPVKSSVCQMNQNKSEKSSQPANIIPPTNMRQGSLF